MAQVKYSFEQWCLDNGHQDWLDLWDYELNEISPSEVAYRSNKKYWFKCPRDLHESESWEPNTLATMKKPFRCRKCHSFGQLMLDTYGTDAIERYRSPDDPTDWFSISPQSSSVKVLVKCSNDAHPPYLISPGKFWLGRRCALCSNKRTEAGINDVATTHPDRIKYFKFTEDARKYTVRSGKRVWFKCPDCGTEKFVTLDAAFCGNHYICRGCGDGASYGSKFVRELLRQLQSKNGLHYEIEKTFEWSRTNNSDKRYSLYDFYVKANDEFIIEVHGFQHYDERRHRGLFRPYEVEHANDVYKRELAISHGIKPQNYIEINCSESIKDFVKQSILGSNMPELFDFSESDVDWDKCDEFAAMTNLIKETARLWNSGIKHRQELADLIGCSKSTIYTYIKKASQFGWIEYEPGKHERILTTPAIKSGEQCEAA